MLNVMMSRVWDTVDHSGGGTQVEEHQMKISRTGVQEKRQSMSSDGWSWGGREKEVLRLTSRFLA